MDSFINDDISLVNKNLSSVPEDVLAQSHWNKVSLAGNKIKSLDDRISDVSVNTLDLSNNPLSAFPKQVCEINGLKELKLNDIKFENVSEDIGKLSGSLNVLELNNCDLFELPKEIGSLVHLRILKLSNNQLKLLPEELAQLENLEEIYLDNNHFIEIPASVLGMKNLKIIFMGCNQIAEIPDEISNLEKLEILSLQKNKIQTISPLLGTLTKLVRLYLAHNKIAELPQEIGKLKQLKQLMIGNNKLKTLPATMQEMNRKLILNTDKNPFNEPEGISEVDCDNNIGTSSGENSHKIQVKMERLFGRIVPLKTVFCDHASEAAQQ